MAAWTGLTELSQLEISNLEHIWKLVRRQKGPFTPMALIASSRRDPHMADDSPITPQVLSQWDGSLSILAKNGLLSKTWKRGTGENEYALIVPGIHLDKPLTWFREQAISEHQQELADQQRAQRELDKAKTVTWWKNMQSWINIGLATIGAAGIILPFITEQADKSVDPEKKQPTEILQQELLNLSRRLDAVADSVYVLSTSGKDTVFIGAAKADSAK